MPNACQCCIWSVLTTLSEMLMLGGSKVLGFGVSRSKAGSWDNPYTNCVSVTWSDAHATRFSWLTFKSKKRADGVRLFLRQ